MLTNFWNYLTDRLSLTPAQHKWLSLFDYTSVIRPFPEARQTLRFVRARGLKVGILSNFGLASLDRSLKATNLFDLIDIACRAAVIGYAKPSPLAYQHITNALSVAPHECLFFDDEQSCVDGARAVGMIAHLVDRENECIPLDHLVSDSFAAISTM